MTDIDKTSKWKESFMKNYLWKRMLGSMINELVLAKHDKDIVRRLLESENLALEHKLNCRSVIEHYHHYRYEKN